MTTRLSALVDEATERALLALPIVDRNEIPAWFELIRDAAAHSDDWAELESFITGAAAGYDPTRVAAFLGVVADGGGHAVLVRLTELEDQVAHLLPMTDGEGDPLDWVSARQRDQLAAVLGPDWADRLAADLEQRWGSGWQDNPVEHKSAWLQDLIAAAAFGEPDPLGWVTADQHPALETALGAQWAETLPGHLEQLWGPGWQDHPGDHKAAWLRDALANGALAGVSAHPGTDKAPDEPAMDASEALDALIDEAMTMPGFAELPEEEQLRILNEVIEKAGS